MSLEVPVTGSAWVNFDHRCTSSSPCGQPRKLCVFGGAPRRHGLRVGESVLEGVDAGGGRAATPVLLTLL